MQLGLSLRADMFPALSAAAHYVSSTNIVPSWPSSRAVLSSMTVASEFFSDAQLVGHAITHPPGTLLRLPPEATQYLGWVAAKAPTRPVAEQHLQRLTAMISYTLSNPPEQ